MVEVEDVEEIGGEVRDGAVLRFEENPAPAESVGPLRLTQNVTVLEFHAEPHRLRHRR